MKEKEWLCFEKSGRVSDYLNYCQSNAGRLGGYGDEDTKRCGRQDGADLYTDRYDTEDRPRG